MRHYEKIKYRWIGLMTMLTVLVSSCDFQDSLLAPESQVVLDDDPITIVTDEFGAQYAEGQFTVAFHTGTERSIIEDFARTAGDEIDGYNETLSWVYLRSDRPVTEVEEDWDGPEWTQTAVRDYLLTVTLSLDDSESEDGEEFSSNLIGDPRIGEQWGLEIINVQKTWDEFEAFGEGANIGVLDGPWFSPTLIPPDPSENVQPYSDSHEDLDGKWDKIAPIISPNKVATQIHQTCQDKATLLEPYGTCWESQISHASHVAGIISSPINEVGIVGVAPESHILPLDAARSMTIEPFSEGIRRLILSGADVINISLGLSKNVKLPGNSLDINEWTEWMDAATKLWVQVFNEAHKSRVLIVNAAGNDGGNASYDMFVNLVGIIPNGIVVGATGGLLQKDVRTGFSNWGPVVDIYAPGRRILSTVPCEIGEQCELTGKYERKNGTSMAAPHVAGVAALIYSIGKEKFGERPTPEAVKSAIIEGSKIGGVFIDNEVNQVPRLNAFEAVRYYLREACHRLNKARATVEVNEICTEDNQLTSTY